MCCLAAASVESNLSEHGDVLLVTIFICFAHHMLFSEVFPRAVSLVLYHLLSTPISLNHHLFAETILLPI